MKISKKWLDTFFDAPLAGEADDLARDLTFHAFEIEEMEQKGDDAVLDVKVTANRGHDCLSYRGIAKEIAAVRNLKLANDPLADKPILTPSTDKLAVAIENTELCARYVGALVRGVKVGPSPAWLKERVESIGERSINNIVDATNYAMFMTGQPLHAFDADKLAEKNGTYAIKVRTARNGERITALDGKEYSLNESVLMIADANADTLLGIAGIKGGAVASVTEKTTDIILEAACFNGISIRRTARALKLRTEASQRFEQVISNELAGVGLSIVVKLIRDIAGGEIDGFVDVYSTKEEERVVVVSTEEVTALLGNAFGEKKIRDAFDRLGFSYTENNGTFTITSPFERFDLIIPEDLIEEVGRIGGYEKVLPTPLSKVALIPVVNPLFYWSEKIRDILATEGFSEIITSVFSDTGKRAVANKLGGDKPYLRSDLVLGLRDALMLNYRNKDLLGLSSVRIFEIGRVFLEKNESTRLVLGAQGKKADARLEAIITTLSEKLGGIAIEKYTIARKSEGEAAVVEIDIEKLAENLPLVKDYDSESVFPAIRYRPFSRYPFVTRDIALFVPEGVAEGDIAKLLRKESGALLARLDRFDVFEKTFSDGTKKTSSAFRLVFQSYERTLDDGEVNAIMKKITAVVNAHSGWQVR